MTLRSRFFAMTYDRQMAKVEKAGLRTHRETVLAEASGRVLEIGAGTGCNMAFYGSAVEALTMTEPEIPMLRRLERKARSSTRRAFSSCVHRPRIFPSRTTRSTPPSRPWCSAVSMTSREPFVNCAGCCDLVAGSSSSSTSGPTIRASLASKIA